MSHPDIIFLKMHKMSPQGTVESFQFEIDSQNDRVIKRTPIIADVSPFYTACIDLNKSHSEETFKFNCRNLQDNETSIRVIKLGGIEDLNPMNYATEISTILNDPAGERNIAVANPVVNTPAAEIAIVANGTTAAVNKRESKIPNIPTMIICQNCDTNFPTKYQYQRHQCEFNADKVILKPNADVKDIDKGMRMKFDCPVCGKQFVSKNNLDRHQTSHDDANVNICEYCNKQFVSENRLRIHKENHCKKAGDISKFYRSDVHVWKCLKCNQVFSKCHTALAHATTCFDYVNCEKDPSNEYARIQNVSESSDLDPDYDEAGATQVLRHEIRTTLAVVAADMCSSDSRRNDIVNEISETDAKYVEKVSTEILLQCEFCNRIYADKEALITHQQSHTTSTNYECITCESTFDSYVNAAKHWLTPCNISLANNGTTNQQLDNLNHANLFYLPKLSLCEICDRTFKSHELLYAHKIKKRHYNVKKHSERAYSVLGSKDEQPANKEKIVKLIEDVLLSMNEDAQAVNTSITIETGLTNQITNKNNDQRDVESPASSSALQSSSKPNLGEESIKLEKRSVGSDVDDDGTSTIASDEEPEENLVTNVNVVEGGKKKRGRKRKFPLTQEMSTKMVGRGINKPGTIDANGTLTNDSVRFQCERCIRVFNKISEMENHREIDHPANYKCEECDQVVHSAKALLIHSRAHQSLKPYVCEICKRCYSQTSHLWQHMRFHQGIKPFACPHEGCEARYTIRPDLKDHIRKVHTRERPFKCSVCDKCFLTGSVYYQHRLIHTNDRRYGCDICQKRFFRADALNNHRRIHTDERPYGCEVCGRQFRQKGDRNKHLRTQHPIQAVAVVAAVAAAAASADGKQEQQPTVTVGQENEYEVVGSMGLDGSFNVIGI